MKKQQSGFTLIELIMVIVILGILSAFALPRFADLSGDAEQAAIQGALGAVKSASAISHAAALAGNQTGATGTVTLEGQSVALVYGYPGAAAICTAAGMTTADFTCTAAGTVTTISRAGSAQGDACFTYTEAAAANGAPTISAIAALSATSACP